MSEPHTVSESAQRLGVSVSTVRRFTDTFQPILPDYARRASGSPRELSEHDLRTLWAILEEMNHRPHGASREELLQEIEAGDVQLVVPATLPTVTTTTEEPTKAELMHDYRPQQTDLIVARNMGEVREALERLSERLERSEEVTALKRRIEAQERQIERQQRELDDVRQRIGTPLLWMLVGAFIVAVVAAGIAVSLIAFVEI